MDKDLSTKEYGNVKTVLHGMIRYARFEKKYTSINISNFFGDFRVGKNILKKSEKLMRKNVLLMKNEFAYGTLHIQRIETRAFTQDTSTAKKKSYINNQRLLSI